jgi:calcium-dependent protein kinase
MDLVMECMEGGELFDRMKELKRFPQCETAEVTWQMLLALNYIHEQGIMHGDVKMENFMFDSKDGNNLKLIDFGFSKVRGQAFAEKICGTVAYIAPECLKLKYSTQADMWSLGVIVFCLLSGSMPFAGSEQEQLSKIQQGKYSMKKERWGYLANESIDFTRALLRLDPRKRLTAQEALRHPFIASKHFGQKLQVDSSVLEAMCDFGHQSKFRRSCLFIMAWSLSSEERAAVEEYFLAMDQNHSGAITYEELKNVMVDKFKISPKEMNVAFQALSVKSGKGIQYSDFLAAMVSSRIALSNELLQDCFQKFDVDANGFITTDNLVEVLGDKFNGIPTESMLDDVDTLHDGKMCWHEFVCFMKGKKLHLRGDEFIPEETGTDSTDEGDVARKPSGGSVGRTNSPRLMMAGRGGLPQHPALNPNPRPAAPPAYREPQCNNACSLM